MSTIFILYFTVCRMEEEQYYMGRGFGPGGRPFGIGPMGGVSSKKLTSGGFKFLSELSHGISYVTKGHCKHTYFISSNCGRIVGPRNANVE